MITNPYLRDIVITAIEGTSQLTFSAIATKIAHPLPKGDYLKEYEKLIQKEGVALPIAAAVAEKSEVEEMRSLIASAITLLETEKIEDARQRIEKAVAETSCNRCSRKMVQINWQDKDTALDYLRTMHKLLPAYYSILEGESAMQIPHTATNTQVNFETKKEAAIKKSEGGKGGEIEEVCEECRVSEILETCHWDVKCIDAVIHYAEELKAKGEKVLSEKLLTKATDFKSL